MSINREYEVAHFCKPECTFGIGSDGETIAFRGKDSGNGFFVCLTYEESRKLAFDILDEVGWQGDE